MAIMGAAALLFGWTLGALTLLSGYFIVRRKCRTFSLVIAGINCLSIPLGTTLGVFTIIVLMRDSVKTIYTEQPAP